MKSKFRFWINLATICLCICAVVVGVYSAISANLIMTGSLGFNMHNASVAISGTIYNLAETDESNTYANKVDRKIARTIMGGETTTSASIPLEDMYFYYGAYTDGTETTTKIYDIIFAFSFTNVSTSTIQATFPTPTVGAGVTLLHNDSTLGYTDFSSEYSTIISQNASITVKFALHLNSIDAISGSVNFAWNNISFVEVEKPLQANEITYSLTATDCTVDVTSTKVGYSTGGSAYQTIRQNVQMGSSNTITVTNNDSDGTTQTVDVGKLAFADTVQATPVVLTLTATNKSSTQVSAMIVASQISDTSYTIEYILGTNLDGTKAEYNGAIILDANASITFVVTLIGLGLEQAPTNDLAISATFTKYETIPETYEDEQGLLYTLINDGKAWSVASGYEEYDDGEWNFISNLNVSDVVIPSELFGIPVTEIATGGFGAVEGVVGDYNMKTIVIPNSITTIGSSAFWGCYFTSVVIPESVTNIGVGAFGSCYELIDVTLPSNLKSISPWLFACSPKLFKIDIPTSVTKIEYYAFGQCDFLREVIIPDSVEVIEQQAFNYCPRLTKVTIGESVKTIESQAFYGCSIVEILNKSDLTLTLGSSDYGGIAEFAETIITDESQSKFVTDENGFVIYNNTTLAYYLGTNKDIIIPSGITEIANDAFYYRTDLTGTLEISNTVEIIGDSAFKYCTGLTGTITIPDSVKTIGKYAFMDCKLITEVIIGSSVEEIGTEAFCFCYELSSVTIGESVNTIGSEAFNWCKKLATVINKSELEITAGTTDYGYVAYYATEVINP